MEGSLVAYKVFTNGSVLNASEINDNLMNQAVMVFSNSAARSAAITSPLEGMLTWLEDSNKYQNYNGTAWVDFGGTSAILQVASTVKVDAFTSTSLTFADLTGLSVSITPSSASSKILVFLNTYMSQSGAGEVMFNLVRGSTAISQSTGATNNATMFGSVGGSNQVANVTSVFLDSPATTSATTYKAQLKVGGGTAFINRRGQDTTYGATSSITVMEVSA